MEMIDKSLNKKVPELRFSGFTDDWEQRELSEISEKVTEKNKDNLFSETLTNSAEHGIINQRDFFDKDISNEKNLNGYYVVRENDFVYNPRISNFAPVGPIKRNKLGRTGVMSPLYYVFSTKNIDNSYLEYFFENTTWHKFMKLNGDSGARSDRFVIKDSVFKEMPIPYPSLEEQEKIGKFFDNLTSLITLHQRKLDLLKEQKKGYLQKMFPKNGAKVPELRFAGFANDWEQRKLGDLAEIKDSARIPNIKWQKEGVPYLRSSDLSSEHIKDGLFLSLADYMKYDKITGSPKKGDLIFASGGDIGLAIYKHDSLPIYVQGGSILYVKTSKCENLDGLFLKYSFASPKVKKYIRNASTGTSLKHFVLKPANALPISYPDLIEQEKIGSLLMQMDSTITLHQRKLDLLKEQKKGFLQKMFV